MGYNFRSRGWYAVPPFTCDLDELIGNAVALQPVDNSQFLKCKLQVYGQSRNIVAFADESKGNILDLLKVLSFILPRTTAGFGLITVSGEYTFPIAKEKIFVLRDGAIFDVPVSQYHDSSLPWHKLFLWCHEYAIPPHPSNETGLQFINAGEITAQLPHVADVRGWVEIPFKERDKTDELAAGLRISVPSIASGIGSNAEHVIIAENNIFVPDVLWALIALTAQNAGRIGMIVLRSPGSHKYQPLALRLDRAALLPEVDLLTMLPVWDGGQFTGMWQEWVDIGLRSSGPFDQAAIRIAQALGVTESDSGDGFSKYQRYRNAQLIYEFSVEGAAITLSPWPLRNKPTESNFHLSISAEHASGPARLAALQEMVDYRLRREGIEADASGSMYFV